MKVNGYYKVLRKWFRKAKRTLFLRRWVNNRKSYAFFLLYSRWVLISKTKLFKVTPRWHHEQHLRVKNRQKYYQSIVKKKQPGSWRRQTANQDVQGNSIDVTKRGGVPNRFLQKRKVKQFNHINLLMNRLSLSWHVQPVLRVKPCFISNQLLQTGLLARINLLGFLKFSRVVSSGVVSIECEVMNCGGSPINNSPQLTIVREFVTWSKNKLSAIQKAKEEYCRGNDSDENSVNENNENNENNDNENNGELELELELETSHFSPLCGFHQPYYRSACGCKRCNKFIKIKNRGYSRVRGVNFIAIKNPDCQNYEKYRSFQEKFLQKTQKELIKYLRKVIDYLNSKGTSNNIIDIKVTKDKIKKEIDIFKENIDRVDMKKEGASKKSDLQKEVFRTINKMYSIVAPLQQQYCNEDKNMHGFSQEDVDPLCNESSLNQGDEAADSNHSGEILISQVAASSLRIEGDYLDIFTNISHWEEVDHRTAVTAGGLTD